MPETDSSSGSHAAVAEPPESTATSEAPSTTQQPIEPEPNEPPTALAPDRKQISPPPPAQEPSLACPVYRRLHAYAFDPSFSARFETYEVNRVTLEIPW